jgi:hypothetical protein
MKRPTFGNAQTVTKRFPIQTTFNRFKSLGIKD